VERVVLIPSARPPHKLDRALTPVAERLAMCRLVADEDRQFEVSEWEAQRSGPNYTLHTIEHFRERHGEGAELYWLIGMDSLGELGSWHRAAELVDACTIVTAARPGVELPDGSLLARDFSVSQIEKLRRHVVEGPRIDIAGRDIRARLNAGRSIRYLVPECVRRYIEVRGLYRER
jgi:nicotinate-nucleotide adenylyltransferase